MARAGDVQRKKRADGERSRSRLLSFIAQYTTEHSRPPSYVEMARGSELTGASVNWHLKVLEREGRVHIAPGARGVTLVDTARAS